MTTSSDHHCHLPETANRGFGRVRIKICGIQTLSDALAISDAGADWIGLNFAPTSHRRIDPLTAAHIVESLRTQGRLVQPAALFVNANQSEIARILDLTKIPIVQLHGNESPVFTAALLGNFPSLQIVKAFRVSRAPDLIAISDYVAACHLLSVQERKLAAVLVDANVPGQMGGTGVSIANDVLSLLDLCQTHWPPLILAGGLKPSNVADRLKIVRPWMVDVASGVEEDPKARPGEKSLALIKQFVHAVQHATVDP